MGCTSSAPSTIPPTTPQANATDIELEEEINSEESKPLRKVTTVELPECDTVMNQVEVAMVASNSESSMKIASALLDPKDVPKDEPAQSEVAGRDNKKKAKEDENNKEAKDTITVKSDDKITNMEDVVEKVVELYITDSTSANALSTEEIGRATATPCSDDGDGKVATTEQTISNEAIEQENEEELSSVVSPTQSQSSRATRWEALADIAAELPPSLTVDPLTGQIYAVSK